MPNLIYDLLEKGKGIHRNQIRGISTSLEDGTMKVILWDGAEHTIDLTEAEPFTRHGCSRCEDFLGDQADVSLGTVGAKRGFSTLVIRTPTGKIFFNNAQKFGLLEISDDVDTNAVNAAKSEKDRRRVAMAYDEFHILMLEALGDPKKRASVRQQFVKLYGAPQPRDTLREKSNVNCGGC
jgi:coenzyme F420-reducing hydrogenase beta subunit